MKKQLVLFIILIIVFILVLFGIFSMNFNKNEKLEKEFLSLEDLNITLENNESYKLAVVSGGCFWCVETDLEKLEGVIYAISGYTSNDSRDTQPIYNDVASGRTKFRESVLVVYDSQIVSYEEIIMYFFTIHDASDEGGSFYDRGFQYTSAIYYNSEDEKKIINDIITQVSEKNLHESKIITSVEEFVNFYPAEKYHQDYYLKNPIRYNVYRTSSGREKFVNELQEKAKELED